MDNTFFVNVEEFGGGIVAWSNWDELAALGEHNYLPKPGPAATGARPEEQENAAWRLFELTGDFNVLNMPEDLPF